MPRGTASLWLFAAIVPVAFSASANVLIVTNQTYSVSVATAVPTAMSLHGAAVPPNGWEAVNVLWMDRCRVAVLLSAVIAPPGDWAVQVVDLCTLTADPMNRLALQHPSNFWTVFPQSALVLDGLFYIVLCNWDPYSDSFQQLQT